LTVEPTPGTPAPTAAPDPPKEVMDALSAIIGTGTARATRVGIVFLMGLASRAGIPAAMSGPVVDTVVQGVVTAALAGIGKWGRSGWTFPAKVPLVGGVRVNGFIPSWFPI
jgi:hypothetical protein